MLSDEGLNDVVADDIWASRVNGEFSSHDVRSRRTRNEKGRVCGVMLLPEIEVVLRLI